MAQKEGGGGGVRHIKRFGTRRLYQHLFNSPLLVTFTGVFPSRSGPAAPEKEKRGGTGVGKVEEESLKG